MQWRDLMMQVSGVYRPRFKLDTRVLRVPVIPGMDPRTAYGNLADRNIKGIVLEAFGVGNMPDLPKSGWLLWLRSILKQVLTGNCPSESTHDSANDWAGLPILSPRTNHSCRQSCRSTRAILCIRADASRIRDQAQKTRSAVA